MKFLANLGPERKKILWLSGLVLVIPIAYFLSKSSTDTPVPPTQTASTAEAPRPSPAIPALPNVRRESPSIVPMQRGSQRGGPRPTDDFKPSLKPKEGVDLSGVDPTLHLDRLAKLHNLAMEGGARSVFKEGSAPVPPPPPTVVVVGPVTTKPVVPAAPPPETTAPPPPPPAPIPLKFYGYASPARGGGKRAFFLDGDDIQIAGENELIKNRYRIIRIGVNSAVVEDTTDKHQQTLPLVEVLEG